ncbi:helix-turn-helix domain-containing protein [Micromonospora ureilytica]|uniref:helix-turn-helix domain-containing protein n=1 Tax=Micromonospora ureilytica TaxID=709868 RepID=UPI00355855B2
MTRNDTLGHALRSTGLTVADLAEKCGVDPKTVERWISRGRIPHPRSRMRAAGVLGQDVGCYGPKSSAALSRSVQTVSWSACTRADPTFRVHCSAN